MKGRGREVGEEKGLRGERRKRREIDGKRKKERKKKTKGGSGNDGVGVGVADGKEKIINQYREQEKERGG